jgi:poly(3-hydroxyalkanoate) synthetase
LFELIQYTHEQKLCIPESVLFVPAWTLILHLTLSSKPMVAYLVAQVHGFRDFMDQPDGRPTELSLEDETWCSGGAGRDQRDRSRPEDPRVDIVSAVHYCLTAATMARLTDLPPSILMAAQVDFAEAGELLLLRTKAGFCRRYDVGTAGLTLRNGAVHSRRSGLKT